MQVSVIVQSGAEGRYTAEPLGQSDLRVEGASEAEALFKLKAAIRRWLETAKLVQLDVPLESETTSNPWLKSFGRSENDPDFDEFVAEMKRARCSDEPE